jgi:hypothetical protein
MSRRSDFQNSMNKRCSEYTVLCLAQLFSS